MSPLEAVKDPAPTPAPEGGAIYRAMPAIMKEVGGIAKSRKNPQQGYMFRGIDEVYEHCQLVLAKHGVCVVPFVQNVEREVIPTKSGGSMASVRLLVDHTFYAEDGSRVVARTLGEAMDSGDKASNKAMSAAMKYALVESLCIPTRGPKDTEDDSPEMGAPPAPKASAPAVAAPSTDASAGSTAPDASPSEAKPTAAEINDLRKTLEKVVPGDGRNFEVQKERARYIAWATDGAWVDKLTDLTRPQWYVALAKAKAGEVPPSQETV